jgi:Mor family transcriptional regulator
MNPSSSRMPALDRAPSPATLYDQIGHSIGGDAADKLIADFGGRRLYIPIAPSPKGSITRSIGLLAALAMARVFGGDRLFIPSTSAHLRRRARILAMRADGVSISRIARALRCTERYVYKVLASTHASENSSSRACSPSLAGRRRGAGSSTTSAPIAERLKRGHINHGS